LDCFWSSYFSSSDIGYILMEIWDEVIKDYNEELNKLKNIISNGTAESFANYRQLVGHIQGIEWARENFTTIVKRRMYDEEE
jgi:hypothetical protein